MNADVFQLADNVIRRQKLRAYGLSVEGCLKIFGVSRSGYYSWKQRMRDKVKKDEEIRKELSQIVERFRSIIKKLGFIPGKRTFRDFMFRDYNFKISVKRCAKIMRMMNLIANRPKKDAYKGQATHDHRCASPENKVKQDFYIGPRKVILTDITYLYYGKYRSTIYLCAFKDAFTKEILGAAVSTSMTTELVKIAYDRMMDKHSKEINRNTDCYIHSDQGSQYLSTTFKEILSDDKFIQSVSRRGNSQDNAPMESFFGQMKCRILDLVALCPDSDVAARLIEGYLDDYNNKIYQYSLAGLTPAEYYTYVTTGIYPCDSYYGVEIDELLTIGELVNARLEAARNKAAKVREQNRAKREAAEQLVSAPTLIISRDKARLDREKGKWKKTRDAADKQISHIEGIIEKTREALKFIVTSSKEILEELKYPQNWQKYKELDYIFEMRQLF